MSLAAIVLATLIIVRAIARRKHSSLLAIAVLALPAGAIFTVCAGPRAPRTRIGVTFVGYRIPASMVANCHWAPNLHGNQGVWIGGGERGENDPLPDVLGIPGYR
ncbi:MAG: hypothetical protein QOE68_879, partial [Thermoanaerobaculia bacterium]|nr:hypothetical protein [Thermoanaerobaculia bacterium]